MAFELSIVHSVLNVKTLVGTFNQEKALVGRNFDEDSLQALMTCHAEGCDVMT